MIEFIKSDFSNTEELKKLWLDCFEDTAEAVELLLKSLQKEMSVYCAIDGKNLAAAVYLIDGRLNGCKAHYLCGASTKEEYRSHGIMSRLIEYALTEEKANGCIYSILLPADDRLYGFYSRLGYNALCSVQRYNYSRQKLGELAEVNRTKSKINYEKLQKSCFDNNFFEWSDSCIEFAKTYYKLYDVKIIEENGCLAMLEEKNNSAEIFYSLYDRFPQLAELLLKNSNANSFEFIDKTSNNLTNERYGMIKSLNNTKIPENVYIGITLN